MIAFNLLMFSALFATLDAVKLKNPKLTESLFQMESSGDLVEGNSTAPQGCTMEGILGLPSQECVGENTACKFPVESSSFTLEFWLKLSSAALDYSVVLSTTGTLAMVFPDNRILFQFSGSGLKFGLFFDYVPDIWTHYFWQRIPGDNGYSLWIDGNQVQSPDNLITDLITGEPMGSIVITAGNMTFGGYTGLTLCFWDVKYWSGKNLVDGFCKTCSSEAVTCGDGYDPKGEGELSCTTCANDGTECCTVSDTGTDIDAGASGDPHFRGFDGSQYDFQGSPGAVFNLITDEAFQLNARFVESPTDGKTYMGALGLKVGSNDILITPDIVLVNDASIAGGKHVYLHNEEISDHLGLLIRDRGHVHVKTEPFQLDIRIVEQEGFVCLDISAVAVSKHLVHPHGILGQTAQYMVDGSEPHPVHLSHQNLDAQGFLAGLPGDYVVSDGLFGTTFPFNHFGTGATSTNTRTVLRFGVGNVKGQEQA